LGDADDFKNGRRDVGDVMELVADAALLRNALRPVDDQGIADAAAMGVLLVAFAWRVADLGPAPRIIVEAHRRADAIDDRHALVNGFRPAIEIARVVDHA